MLWAIAGLAGCAGVIGLDDLHRTAGGTDAGAGARADGGSGPTPASSAPPAVSDPSCPGRGGPPSVRVSPGNGTFCIDATEVTNADYAAFLAATPAPGLPPPVADGCDRHDDLHPSQGWPAAPGDAKHPVTWVDWCDAAAYCAWAGKALCGKEGGGSLDPSDDAASGAWYSACAGGALASGGSVAEWEDSCSSEGDQGSCAVREAFDTAGASGASGAAACAARTILGRTARAPDVGFRCCSR